MVLLTSAAILAGYLQKDLWYDEAWTLNRWLSRGFLHVLTNYDRPNNHILYNATLWPVFHLFGGYATPVPLMRALSAAYSLLAVLFLFAAARRRGGALVGLLAAGLFGLSHVYFVYGYQLRGYAFTGLLAAAGLYLIVRLCEDGRARWAWSFIGLAVVAPGVLPTNSMVFGVLASLHLGERLLAGASPRRLLQALGLCASPALGLLIYLPSADALLAHAQTYGGSARLLVLAGLAEGLLRDWWWLLPFVAIGLWPARRGERSDRSLWLWVSVLLGAAPAAIALGVATYGRAFFGLVPGVWLALALLAARGLERLGERLLPTATALRGPAGSLLLALVLAATAVAREVDDRRRDRAEYGDAKIKSFYAPYYVHRNHPTRLLRWVAARKRERPEAVFLADKRAETEYYQRRSGVKLLVRARAEDTPEPAELLSRAAHGELYIMVGNTELATKLPRLLRKAGIEGRVRLLNEVRFGYLSIYQAVPGELVPADAASALYVDTPAPPEETGSP